jgi:hypothetical protein
VCSARKAARGLVDALPVAEVLEGKRDGHLLLFKVVAVDLDAVMHKLALLCVEEGGLGREVGDDGEANQGRKDGEQTPGTRQRRSVRVDSRRLTCRGRSL